MSNDKTELPDDVAGLIEHKELPNPIGTDLADPPFNATWKPTKQCPCQFGEVECAFPDCYTKQELVDAIEAKNREIRELTAPVGDVAELVNRVRSASQWSTHGHEMLDTITRLSRENEEKQSWINKLIISARTKDDRIAELEAQNKDKSQLLASFRITLDAARAERDKYRDMCAEYDKALETIEQGRTPGSGLHQTSATFAKSERKRIAGMS